MASGSGREEEANTWVEAENVVLCGGSVAWQAGTVQVVELGSQKGAKIVCSAPSCMGNDAVGLTARGGERCLSVVTKGLPNR